VLDEFVDIFLWQFPQGVDDEVGAGEVFSARGNGAGSIALGACIVGGCEARLCAAALALSIVVAFSLVNGSAGRADGRAAITLWGEVSARKRPPVSGKATRANAQTDVMDHIRE